MSDLPIDWAQKPLGTLGDLRTSSVDKISRPRELPVSLVNYMDVYRSRIISKETPLMQVTASFSQIQRSALDVGDVLFTPSSETPEDIGHSAVVDSLSGTTLHSYHTVRFRPHGSILDNRYSGYLGESEDARSYFRQRAAGSTRFTLSRKDFRELEILLPPIQVQRRIAEILDTLDDQIHESQLIVEKLKLGKLGMSHDLLDGSGWPFVPVGEVSQVRNGTTPSRARRDYWDDGTVSWLASGKVNEYIVSSASEFVTARAVSECGLRIFPPGSVIIGMIGEGKTRGMAARLDLHAAINQNLAGVIPSDELYGGFLHHYLVHSYQRLRSGGRGSNQDALNTKLVAEFPIPLPPVKEQRNIALALDALDLRVRHEELAIAKLNLLKNGVASDVLTGHVRVPLEVSS
jgi:type I restriction enzyme S subunit